MAMLFPSVGKKRVLEKFLKDTENALTLRLYSNDVTPGNTDVAGTYTEVSGGGYAAVALASGDWTISNATPSVASGAQKSFAFTGAAGNVYGYYVTDADGTLVFADRFGSVRTINYSGDTIKITPTINLS